MGAIWKSFFMVYGNRKALAFTVCTWHFEPFSQKAKHLRCCLTTYANGKNSQLSGVVGGLSDFISYLWIRKTSCHEH